VTVRIPTTSRLNRSVWTVSNNGTDDIEFWDLPIFKRVPVDPTDTIIPVDKYFRIDQIAADLYQDSALWDVIAEANGFRRLPQDMKVGDKIRLPTYQRVITTIRNT